MKTWTIEEQTGYKPITTFYDDFTIADHFGIEAIEDTYKRAFNEWKIDYKYLTELSLVMNWKVWEHYTLNENYCMEYNMLWSKIDDYCMEHLKSDELDYYIRTTD